MKSQLIAIVAAVLFVGCGESQQSAPPAEAKPVAEAAKPKSPTGKAPDIDIHFAAMFGNLEAVKQHITAGADVNAIDDDRGMTPLLMAAVGIETVLAPVEKEIVELLIAKGADVNALIVSGPSEFKGKTPLDLAKRHPELTDLLRKHGGKADEELKAESK